MNVLVFGKTGQVAQALVATAPAGITVTALGRNEIDISDAEAVEKAIQSHSASWVINAAAYTAVDKAEEDMAGATELNSTAASHIAKACKDAQTKLIHLSTDFVFDGQQSHPYKPNDKTNPLGVYGQSKLDGELGVLSQLNSAIVIRTSWVFSQYGNNFVKTMLRLMKERDELSVVCDQIGSPSSADDLATFIWQMTQLNETPKGVFHWTNAGACSWYDFAEAIYTSARSTGLLTQAVSIRPIPSSAYPTPAKRPSYSVLDKQSSWAITPTSRHWQTALQDVINQLKSN
ncbi:MAG: dTDP-4-dehydrorhamnose reductase [Gammaproteobacteria bacterium]|nr:dTDP-4-dehydrorhamnose reductase [Gammaproteobacteria bacterium]